MGNEKLIRSLSRKDITAIAINTVIGAGIFGLPSKIAALIGSYSLIAFVVCALIVALIVICFAEVASRFQNTGGMYLYAKHAFGSAIGFEVGWLYWFVRVTTFAANCNLLLSYLAFFIPGVNEGVLRVTLIALIVGLIGLVNFLGVRESTILTNIFTIGKLLPLLIFVSVGMFFVQPTNFNFSEVPEFDSFSKAVLLLIYAYVGFEAAVIPAGEMKNPGKDVPFALLSALAVVAFLFFVVQVVSLGTLPELAKSERPLADAASLFLGSFGAGFIAIGALISIFGNLNGGFLSATRIPFAMSEQKELPSFVGQIHPKFSTPYISIFLTSLSIFVLTIQSSFISALTISTITRLLVYATTCAALPVLRRREKISPAQFHAPFGNFMALGSLILIGWLLANADYSKEGLVFIGAVLAGFVIYFLGNVRQKTASSN